MHIKGTKPLSTEKVERTIATVEILTGVKLREKKIDKVFIQDKLDSTLDIEHYRNYSKSGLLNDAMNNQPQQAPFAEIVILSHNEPVENSDIKPDIDVTAYQNWQDPRIQKKIDIIEDLYGRRATESRSMNPKDPFAYARQRYFDPTARHFVGHDLDKWERESAFNTEINMIIANQHGHNLMGSVKLDDPIFEGRGLSRSDPKVPRMEGVNTDRRAATRILLMRRLSIIN